MLRELLAAGVSSACEVRVPPAIGEDACVIEVQSGALIAATDPITLTTHGVGAHAVVINANDVAVTGARPRWYLATILLPLGTTEADVRTLFNEMRDALDEVGAVLVGGHTEVTGAVTHPTVVGQMLGLCEKGQFVRTAGMQASDVVLQIGAAPIEGIAVLAQEAASHLGGIAPDSLTRARAALHRPGISVVEPALRAAALGANALHDPTEGGLSAGLHELAEASGLGLCLDQDAVLWFESAIEICAALGADPWGVLASGTLLAALPEASAGAAQKALEAEGYANRAIARAVVGDGVHRIDGVPLPRYERDELCRILG